MYLLGSVYLSVVGGCLFGFVLLRAFRGEATAWEAVWVIGAAWALAGAHDCYWRWRAA